MDEELIKKFLDDQCSPEELEEILRLSNSAKGEAHILSLLEKKWKEDNVQKDPDFLYEHLFRKITHRISEKESTKSPKTVPGTQQTRKGYFEYFHYAKVAATVAIFVLVSTVLTFNFNNYQQNIPLSAITYVVQSTSMGQKLKFKLPDGTGIILNSASSIKYPDHFPEGKREVFLSGEAFFDVKRDTLSPFIVHNDKITTTALGTSFNIRAANNEVNVALATGRVSVEMEGISRPNEKIYLNPGEMAICKPKIKNIRKENFDVAEVTGWKEGTIHFNQISLNNIIIRLEQWYGVKISLDKKIPGNKILTGKFNNENLESILQGLCFSLECNYTINGKIVEIK